MTALPHSTKDKAHLIYLAGERVTKIAQDLGLKRSTVAQWASRGQWPQERKRIAAKAVETIGRTTTDVTKRHILQHLEHINRVVRAKIDSLAKMPLEEVHSVVEVANALKTLDDVARRNLGLSNEEPAAPRAKFCFHLTDEPLLHKAVEVQAETV